MIRYHVTNTTDMPIDSPALERGLAAAEAKVGQLDGRFVSIEIVTPEESRALNKKLRHENSSTDCISISTDESHVGEQTITQTADGALEFAVSRDTTVQHTQPILGQLVLCYDVIRHNAHVAGQPVTRELEWVIEHGILHLLGFHHEHDS